MSVMFGVSLTITGIRLAAFTQRVTISLYSGTWPTAEPMPRSDMPCGQPQFRSTPSAPVRSEEHTSELHSLMRTPYAVFCLKQKIASLLDFTRHNATIHTSQELHKR